MDKHSVRKFYMSTLVAADISLMPWVLKFPAFIKDYGIGNSAEQWLNYGPVNSFVDLFTDGDLMKMFLISQGFVVAGLVSIGWDVMKNRKKNRISDGLGGPEAAVGSHGELGSSRWQSDKEMDELVDNWTSDKPSNKSAMIIGSSLDKKGREKLWGNVEDFHTLTIGATRSGKGRRIILPSIYEIARSEKQESMIFTDPKGELFITTSEYLKKQGYNIVCLNFRDPRKGNQWNVLQPVIEAVDEGDLAKATDRAWDIATIISGDSGGGEKIWQNGEQSTIAALILIVCMEADFRFQKHMGTVYSLLSNLGAEDEDGTVPLLQYIENLPNDHPGKLAFATCMLAPSKTRGSFFTQTLSTLRLFSNPNVAEMTSKQDHDFKDIGKEKTAVFLIIPDEKATMSVLATLYIAQTYQALVESANMTGGRLKRRVNYILDEFGNVPAIPDFDKYVTVAASRGIRFNIFLQGIDQLKQLYDKKATTISGNCYVWNFLKTSDWDTAKLISDKTGKYTIQTNSSSSSVQGKGGTSFSNSNNLSARALLMPDEVLRWDPKECLVLQQGCFPARYPLQDISQLKANEAFGYIKTGNIDKDKAHAIQMIEDRWNSIKEREMTDAQIWLPISIGVLDVKNSSPDEGKAKINEPIDNQVIDDYSELYVTFDDDIF